MAQSSLTSERPTSNRAPRKGFRADIQGLRAVAVGVVLLYHANAPFLSGGFVGVDVFFVISGFLITGLLLKEAAADGQISLASFYARRAKRILPAATIVLLVSALLTYIILPRTRWDDTATQILAAAFNVVNWVLAGSAVDYLAGDDAASPVQHFWTLAVEEQFYIVWPLMLVLALGIAARIGSAQDRAAGVFRRFSPGPRTSFIRAAVVLLTVPSLVWSIYYTIAEPGAAYFVTTTRAWELGIGAMLAVFAGKLSTIPSAAGNVLGWAGLAAIAASAVFYSSSTPFPGYAALLPTLGAAAVIVGGMPGVSTGSSGALLSTRPFTWVGDISYSLYLWHWPMIVIATFLLDGLEFYQGLIVVCAAVLPAWLSYRFVEQPILKAESLRDDNSKTLQIGTILIIVAGLAAMSILLVPKPVSTAGFIPQAPLAITGEAVARPVLGAELLARDPSLGAVVDAVGDFQPSPLQAADDNPVVYSAKCHQNTAGTDPLFCSLGNESSDFEIAVVGDSHAAQWVPALTSVADKNQWRLKSYSKSACPLTGAIVAGDKGADYAECAAWNTAVLAALTGPDRPDFVLVTSSSYTSTSPGMTHADGLAAAWSALREAGVPFAVIADTPHPKIDVPECAATNPDQMSKCSFSRAEGERNGMPAQVEAAEAMGDVPLINLNRFICPESQCAAVIGKVLVYRDSNHLTATYSGTLATSLEAELRAFDLPFAPEPGPTSPPAS